jgi:hypothetical protein
MTADSLIHGKRRKQVAALLIQHGRELYSRPRQVVLFTPEPAANELINVVAK